MIMHVGIEPDMLESVVFEATRADPMLHSEYQPAFAACFRQPDGDQREQAFAQLHQTWFNRLGLRDRLLKCVQPFSHIVAGVNRIVLADSRRRRQGGIDLFGGPGRYALVIAATPRELLHVEQFEYWARCELHYIDDILNPNFGYERNQTTHATGAARTRRQERIQLLWAIWVDVRVAAGRALSAPTRTRRVDELCRAFSLEYVHATVAYDRFCKQCHSGPLTFRDLLRWADVEIAADQAGQGTESSSGLRVGGTSCALCRFPTFDWAAPTDMIPPITVQISRDFPAWSAHDPVCRRCAELYKDRAVTRQSAILTEI